MFRCSTELILEKIKPSSKENLIELAAEGSYVVDNILHISEWPRALPSRFLPAPNWNAAPHNLIYSLRTIASEDYPLSCRRKRRLCHCLCATVQRSSQDGNQSEPSDNNDKMTSQLSRARARPRGQLMPGPVSPCAEC